jgi:CRISPR-associated exonuclease Cas4
MFAEDDLLPISALQHLLFCPRQCALIHTERLWAENPFTLEGRHLHEKADAGKADRRGALRTGRGLLLRSFRLGLFGKADIVEFRPAPVPDVSLIGPGPAPLPPPDATPPPAPRPDVPYPVEFKRGRPKAHRADEVQLCAQALCLEEMLGVSILAGALFYGKTRRRQEVTFDAPLRALTEQTAADLHALLRSGQTPPAVADERCDHCSLQSLCLPGAARRAGAASRYLDRAFAAARAGDPSGD